MLSNLLLDIGRAPLFFYVSMRILNSTRVALVFARACLFLSVDVVDVDVDVFV